MIIAERNQDSIEKKIKAAEGRATARTINYSLIKQAVKEVEWHLGIPKNSLEGVEVEVDMHAQTFPNAYRYTPESTHFGMIRKKSGWDLEWIERKTTRRESSRYVVRLTDAAKTAILSRMSHFE